MLGRDHPHTLISLFNLAMLLRMQHGLTEARPLFERAYDGLRNILSTDHPVLKSLSELVHPGAQGKE